jgi:hypothetical protein
MKNLSTLLMDYEKIKKGRELLYVVEDQLYKSTGHQSGITWTIVVQYVYQLYK